MTFASGEEPLMPETVKMTPLALSDGVCWLIP